MITGKNTSYMVESSGSATVIKNGLYLSISPVTSANEGEYVCMAKGLNVESMRRYSLTVDGETYFSYTKHAYFVYFTLGRFE